MPKKSLRARMLAIRRELSDAQWLDSSIKAQERLLQIDRFLQSKCIAIYSPVQRELDTNLLFNAARVDGKKVLYPKVCGTELVFSEVTDQQELVSGCFGICEPGINAKEHGLAAVDLMVVPGVAFDLNGHRLGFGKGFYDRCLADQRGSMLLVGFCHDFQLQERIPVEDHDIRMDLIITEKRVVEVVTGP